MERKSPALPDPERLLRYLHGELADSERENVAAAAASDPALAGVLEQMRRAEALAQDILRMEFFDMQAGYRRVQARIRSRRRDRLFRQTLRWAAALLLPLLAATSVLSYRYLAERSSETLYAEVSTPAGAVVRYELPDGSVVWLNAGSSLRYPLRFGRGKREVDLRGEAYFRVEADPETPFYVHTDAAMSVEVFGTAFNVNAYGDEPCIRTSLESGRVRIVVPGRPALRIEPGEEALFDRRSGALAASRARVADACAWREGRLVFRDTPLDEVLHRLARRYNVDIEFRNHTDEVFRYRATFRDETLPQIFDYLSASADIRWRVVAPERQAGDSLTRRRMLVEQF